MSTPSACEKTCSLSSECTQHQTCSSGTCKSTISSGCSRDSDCQLPALFCHPMSKKCEIKIQLGSKCAGLCWDLIVELPSVTLVLFLLIDCTKDEQCGSEFTECISNICYQFYPLNNPDLSDTEQDRLFDDRLDLQNDSKLLC
ncbi:hypothetical protein EB796_000130 [Bugula neritina]|uniref:Uncharacterized protein n=1 Tax=Bugula neritina TaxID=10212 RepID=A0A7J7KTV7_BUGNE|nr:hypothetical protein EB796_000130 [Bugula neritina]